jgi:hypothetical protein
MCRRKAAPVALRDIVWRRRPRWRGDGDERSLFGFELECSTDRLGSKVPARRRRELTFCPCAVVAS